MPAPEHPTDPHGFRVPQRFNDLDPVVRRAPSAYRGRIRWLVGTLFVGVVLALLYRSQLADQGRKAMAEYYLNRAQPYVVKEDYPSAIAEVDHAITWYDAEPRIFLFRGQLHSEAHDLDAAIADYTRAIEQLTREQSTLLPQALMQRSIVYQRQRKVREALDDLNLAYENRPPKDSVLLNARAYARAVFNVELDAALKDIEQAMEWDGNGKNAAMIDTRGYVYFRLGRLDQALADVEQAISLTEEERAVLAENLRDRPPSRRNSKQLLRRYDHDLAVMYHHRGEIHEKLGHQQQAEADLKRAIELGYDHEAGVF